MGKRWKNLSQKILGSNISRLLLAVCFLAILLPETVSAASAEKNNTAGTIKVKKK